MQQHVLFLILLKISMLFQHDLVVLRHENWCYMCHFAGIHLFLGFMEFFQDYWWASNKFYLIRSLIFLCSRFVQRCLFTSKMKSIQIHTQFWSSSEGSWQFIFFLFIQWVPSMVAFVSVVVSFFLKESMAYLPTILFGIYVSWIYLRYFQKRLEVGLRGDPSDEFSFSSFFPGFLRYWFSWVILL